MFRGNLIMYTQMGDRIHDLRSYLGLSLKAFGEAIGFSGNHISRFEKNVFSPDERVIRKRQIYPRKGTTGHQLRYPAENQNMSVTGASPRNASTASPMASRNASSVIQEQVE